MGQTYNGSRTVQPLPAENGMSIHQAPVFNHTETHGNLTWGCNSTHRWGISQRMEILVSIYPLITRIPINKANLWPGVHPHSRTMWLGNLWLLSSGRFQLQMAKNQKTYLPKAIHGYFTKKNSKIAMSHHQSPLMANLPRILGSKQSHFDHDLTLPAPSFPNLPCPSSRMVIFMDVTGRHMIGNHRKS